MEILRRISAFITEMDFAVLSALSWRFTQFSGHPPDKTKKQRFSISTLYIMFRILLF